MEVKGFSSYHRRWHGIGCNTLLKWHACRFPSSETKITCR